MNYNIASKTYRDLEYIKEYESFCSRMEKCRFTLSRTNNLFQRPLYRQFFCQIQIQYHLKCQINVKTSFSHPLLDTKGLNNHLKYQRLT